MLSTHAQRKKSLHRLITGSADPEHSNIQESVSALNRRSSGTVWGYRLCYLNPYLPVHPNPRSQSTYPTYVHPDIIVVAFRLNVVQRVQPT